MATTLRDIAERCGVSRATVSLVIQDSHRVSEPTKERVRAAMVEMGYIYDRRAAHLRSRRAHGFGLVLTDVHNPGLAELAMALEDAAADAECSVVMGFTRDDLGRQNQIIRTMLEYRLDGIVLSPASRTTLNDLMPMVRSGMPHVLVTRRIQGFESDYVGPNNMRAGRLLADHMASLGARSLAFLGGSHRVSARLERARGLRDQWQKLGLPWRAELSIATSALEEGGREAVGLLRERGPLPDAIVGYSDTVVRGILAQLKEDGIRPGRDVAVAGIDNDPMAPHLDPSLSSVDTYMAQVGRDAFGLLLGRTSEPTRTPVTTLIKGSLHVRDSTRLWRNGE
jgi:LacI family transcriptional regulator